MVKAPSRLLRPWYAWGFVLLAAAAAVPIQAQVCDGDVALTSQAEVDAFVCSEITGSLSIEGGDIVDLSPLSSLNRVGGSVGLFDNDVLTSLTGLENLSEVGALLTVADNPALTSLEALGGLTSVGGTLGLYNNDALPSLAGLENLSEVATAEGGGLNIIENDALTSLAGLDNLSSIGNADEDESLIGHNASLTSLEGLENLSSVVGQLIIDDNPVLTSLAGLENLSDVSGGIVVQSNPALASLAAFDDLSVLRGYLIVLGNASLTSLAGLEHLTEVRGTLIIDSNPALASLDGLENLSEVGSFLVIGNNGALTSLTGLERLSSVGDDLDVSENADLQTCSCGLAGLISGGTFSGVGGSVTIARNAPDGHCNAPEEVLSTPCADVTAPVCGVIHVERSGGTLTAVETSVSDAESGIASVRFTRLRNARGFADGSGPFSEGDTQTFDPGATASVDIRGERIDMDAGGSIVVTVENGAGLTRVCDPIIETLSAEVPEVFALEQNYPNPFNPQTEITYALAEAGPVRLEVYDVTGRRVAVLVDQTMAAGRYGARFDGARLPSGVYVYRLTAGGFTDQRTMLLLR